MPLKYGVVFSLNGNHPGSQQLNEVRQASFLKDLHRATIQLETSKTDVIVINDLKPERLPSVRDTELFSSTDLAAYISAITTRLNIVAETNISYQDPFPFSTRIASLDSVSNGRTGWLITQKSSELYSAAYGEEQTEPRPALVDDFQEIAQLIWGSWKPGAIVADAEKGIYIDPDKLDLFEYHSDSFDIYGPGVFPKKEDTQISIWTESKEQNSELVVTHFPDRETPERFLYLQLSLDSYGESAVNRIAELDQVEVWQQGDRNRFVGSAEGLIDYVNNVGDIYAGVIFEPATRLDLDELLSKVINL